MSLLPPALLVTLWRDVDIRVFTIGGDSPLLVTDAAHVLNTAEAERAAKFHFARDGERWMRSRALLRILLAERLDVLPEMISFRTTPQGKPELDEPFANQHPPVQFNISHSGDFAAIAVGEQPVGVDIEQWKMDLPVAELADYEFRPGESESIQRSAAPHRLFYHLWTVKEAVMKCCGMGVTLPPGCIRVEFEEDKPVAAERTDFELKDFPGQVKYFHVTSHEAAGRWTLSAAVCDETRRR